MSDQLFTPFNPLEHDPSQGVGQLPVGRHLVIVESASVEENSSGTGGLVKFILATQEGGKQVYRLNLFHSDEKTVQIAQKQLSALCHVMNVFQLGSDGKQLSALYNIPFAVDIRQQKNDERYTEVARVLTAAGEEPGRPGVVAAAPAPAPQAQAAAPAQASGFGQAKAPANSNWANKGATVATQQAAAPAPAGAPNWAK